MTHGPRRAALDRAIESADPAGIDQGATAWRQLAVRLTVIARGLQGAQQVDLRGRTGDSMRASFARAAEGLQRKSETLQEGEKALDDSREAVERAARDRAAMDSDPALQLGSEPGAFTPDPDRTDAENRTQQGMHAGRVAAYWDTYHRREAESQRIADQLDADLTRSGERMRGIHGEPDPITVTPGAGGAGGAGGGGSAGSAGSAGAQPMTYGGGRAPSVGTGPHAGLDPAASTAHGSDVQGSGDAAPPGAGAGAAAGSSGPPPGTAATEGAGPVQGGAASGGGLAGGAAGGLAAGVAGGLGARGLAGALRGSPSTAGQPVRGQAARPLGSTSRAAVSGALGRGGAAPAAGSTSRAATSGRGPGASRAATAGQPSAARAGSRGGPGRGGQGAQGSRGVAGAVGAGRGRGARDDEADGNARDLFDDGQDWVDDGDAARGVLD